MFRVLDVPAQGPPSVAEDPNLVAPPPGDVLRWIDFEGPSTEHLSLLGDRFGFHPLSLEDSAHFDQRPKIEDYGAYLFIVTHGLECNGDPRNVVDVELHAFLGAGYLVTIHTAPIAPLDEVFLRVYSDPGFARRGADFLYYLVLDAVVDASFPILDRISDQLEDVEDAVIDRGEEGDLAQIFQLKRTLVTMRRVLSPQRDVFAALSKVRSEIIHERTTPYFRDIYDHLARIHESIESGRDLLGNTRDAYLSILSHRTNDVMKRLTVMSAIFLPLTFVTGFFGQNFVHLPFDSDLLMFTMLLSCVAIPGGMLFWFFRSKWI